MNPKTDHQRNALHLWFRQCARVLNDSGMDQHVVIQALSERGVDCPWTEESVKESIFRPIFHAVTGKDSTEQADTKEFNTVHIGLCKWMGQEFGVTLPPFPSHFTQGLDE